ncbi:MAG: ComF family protein [Bacteroidetes bacterium]|nr:ComF family protein [Bacteroidota bacterium]
MKSKVIEVHSWLSDFISLFFPQTCMGCSLGLAKGEEILCTKCILELPLTHFSSFEENPVKERFIGRLPIKQAWALLRYRKSGVVQQLLHQLKYKNYPEIGLRLGKLAGEDYLNNNGHAAFDFIVPVPLHAARLRNRGYNQSTKFAKGIASALKIPVDEKLLFRRSNTNTQTTKTREERWENVQHAFEVTGQNKVEGKRILLVDDVVTTGATLEACGEKLIKAGCKELSIACIAEA